MTVGVLRCAHDHDVDVSDDNDDDSDDTRFGSAGRVIQLLLKRCS